MIEVLGAKTVRGVAGLGRFGRFVWQTIIACARSCISSRTYPLIWTQMNIIGVRSVPVIMVTGAFVGMTLAIQAYDQLVIMGLEERMGQLIGLFGRERAGACARGGYAGGTGRRRFDRRVGHYECYRTD